DPLSIAELPSAAPQMMLLKMREEDRSFKDVSKTNVESLKVAAVREAPAYALTPVISLNGSPIPGPWILSEFQEPQKGNAQEPAATEPRVLARALVSTDLMKDPDGLITIAYPFKGPELSARSRINDPNKDFEVQT